MDSKEAEEALEEVDVECYGLREQIGICFHIRKSKMVPEIFLSNECSLPKVFGSPSYFSN